MNPADIIHRIMGGDMFLQSTGMQKVIVTTRCVTYKLPPNESLATHMSISISDTSLYNMQFFTHYQRTTLATDNYANQELSSLPSLLRQVTGLRL